MIRCLKLAALTAAVVVFSVGGCDNSNTVTGPEEEANSPPTIILSGPEYDPGQRIPGPSPMLWVVAGDPDGAVDIATVFLHVDTVTLNESIVRPDSIPEPCRWVNFSDNDTINVMPLLTTTTFKVERPLSVSLGVYGRTLSYADLIPGGLRSYAPEFGGWVKDCWSGSDYRLFFETFGLYPPALPAARDVHVTYVDLSLKGIRITVYDQSGASATQTFPDFDVFFTTGLEEATLP